MPLFSRVSATATRASRNQLMSNSGLNAVTLLLVACLSAFLAGCGQVVTLPSVSTSDRLRQQAEQLEDKYRSLQDHYNRTENKLAALQDELKMEGVEKQALRNVHDEVTRLLQQKYEDLKDSHADKENRLAGLQEKLAQEEAEMAAFKNSQAEAIRDLEDQYDGLKDDYDKNLEEMAALEDKVQDSRDQLAGLKRQHADELGGLENKYKDLRDDFDDKQKEVAQLRSALQDARDQLKDTAEDLDNTNEKLADAAKDLDKAMKMARSRKDLAKRLEDNFKDHGVDAVVNSETGDVILDFGEDYFETDSHELKPGMVRTIRKAIPVYAESLFGSDLLSPLISSVEIIGFASPTYARKPVDPTSLSVENRTAVNYNLDLSYKRARSIFEYVFDTEKIIFDFQDTMVPLINVTGRSFFAEKIDAELTGNLPIEEFCNRYNCNKSQRVIIKFDLAEKRDS